ncbi:hypothetical protein BC938DRAFT_482089 [Jimgerdemannia flammicorona]|uniref:Prephenate/arogenate dehydrogenase domain-containing protein n=1 Tax=Jimgerdemannia flammicorona TaxID=994334 RepID=A0A433QEQ0_9FUNG|nr:hypothetical protein BC938DRAFT_482089 [Jimgerdemannia flammicorona]
MVSRRSDFIIYSVEAEYIDNVVAQYGPCNNTSTLFPRSNQAERDCRGAEPEIAAFEKHLPADVHIISCHSLHGPTVDTKGQPLVRQCAINPLYFWFRPSKFDVPPSHSFTKVMMKHRASQEKFDLTIRVLSCLESDFVFLSYKEHDRITADTQAVTHAAFLRAAKERENIKNWVTESNYLTSSFMIYGLNAASMGTAWKTDGRFPWENPHFVGGIENVKVNVALRIYGNKWHVYAGTVLCMSVLLADVDDKSHPNSAISTASHFPLPQLGIGLAIMNPNAKIQISQYAKSVADLFLLMITENEEELVRRAGEFVFGKANAHHESILLSDSLLDEYSLSNVPKDQSKPNSHLSLLAMVSMGFVECFLLESGTMVDCWYQLRLNPYEHMVCQTPLFRLWMYPLYSLAPPTPRDAYASLS